jgi:DNA helicase-2/ATP-dependent DNA helicase PcrA
MMTHWCPSEGIEATDELIEVIRCEESVAVLAGAGAGKTELLAQKANYLFFTDKCAWPKRILSLTFKAEAQINIKSRVDKRCGQKGTRFDSFTFHAFSKSIVDRFKNVLPEIDRPVNNYDIVFRPQDANGRDKILMDDLLNISIKILKSRPDLRNIFSCSYSFVFVDEFQDTTNEQYELLQLLFKNTDTKVLTVGDINQSIMLWAGARKTVFKDFLTDFTAISKFMVKNHRASKEIQDVLEIVLQYIKEPNQPINEIATKPLNCSAHIFTDEYQEASFVVNNIIEIIATGVREEDICILTKQQSTIYTEVLRTELNKAGINNLDMTDLQDVLKEPLGQLFSLFLKALVCPEPKVMSELYGINLALNKIQINDDKEEELTTSLINFISSKKILITESTTVDEVLSYIQGFIHFLGPQKLKGRWKQYKSPDYYNSILNNLESHLREMCAQAESLEVAIQLFNAENSIHLMNIHKCKGLEYHAVYFIGLEDEAFWNYSKETFENNCAIYVALSRAKNKLVVTYSKYRAHRRVTSRFDDRPSSHQNVKPIIDLLVDKCRFVSINHAK